MNTPGNTGPDVHENPTPPVGNKNAERARDLYLRLAEVTFRIQADDACSDGLERFRAAWSSAPQGSHLASDGQLVEILAFLDPTTELASARADDQVRAEGYDRSQAQWAIERAVLLSLAQRVKGLRRMMHAGAVMRAGKGYLFVGTSGAGKSSLCLEAVRRGYRYLSDECLVTDGTTVWGIPRAIQFDPPDALEPFPRWLASASLDFTTYASSSRDYRYLRPLHVPGIERTDETGSARDLTVVALHHGEVDSIKRLSGLEALTAILEAAFLPVVDVDLGRLAKGGGYSLTWSDPASALSLLETTSPECTVG
jgi:hypothetical protein